MSRLYMSGLHTTPRKDAQLTMPSAFSDHPQSPMSASPTSGRGRSFPITNTATTGKPGSETSTIELMSQMTVLMTDVKRRMLTVEEENAQLLVEIADVKRTLEHEQRSKLSLERIVEDQQSQIEELRRRLEAETKLRSELETVQARAGSLLLSHHR